MMPKLTFYPLGNADTCLIDLANGKKLLFDYSDERDPNNSDDKRIDLPKALRDDLNAVKRDYYDLLAITHLDDDHTCKADEFFYLDNAKKYQGEGRIKIRELWVPANVITERRNNLEAGAQAIQAEARHRLEKGYGIQVFSRPQKLKKWLEDRGLTIESRSQFITDAGQVAPDFTLAVDGAEFFAHSPFAWRQDENTVIDRNGDSLVMQLTLQVDGVKTKAILGSDVDHEALSAIVQISKSHNNEDRLEADMWKLPHHSSYLSLGPDRGDDETEPVEDVAWLFEDQLQRGGIIISSSKPIPIKGSEDDKSPQPPHRQAAAYYKRIVRERDGEYIVTMEHPRENAPRPLVIEVDWRKAKVKRSQSIGAAALTPVSAPRAG
ncbi:hypothetical protein SH661x_001829 [Planctomicrobium sp. SH661]|uniref:hypothetical protein n=1 Tax=Planctomicrobium sp. SH661 TaxID=3448124 RepID=UPI003F5CB602